MAEVPTPSEVLDITDPAQRLIHAGARLLLDDGFRIIAAGLSPNTVARAAGRTRRTFYDHFETKETFTRAVLLEYLIVAERGALTGDFEHAFAGQILEAEGDVVESIRSLSREIFAARTGSGNPQIQAIAAVLARSDPGVRERLVAYSAEVDGRFSLLIEEAITRWGLKLRPPWTPLLLTTSVRAMATGLYARAVVEPDAIDMELFGDNVIALLSALTQPVHRPDETVDSAFRRVTRTSPASWRESRAPQSLVNSRQRVLDVIAPLLDEVGASGLTLEHIAHAAGVSLPAVSAAFSSLDDAVGQATIATLPALRREAALDLQTEGLDCRAVLGRHFTRLAGWVIANPQFAAYCLTAIAGYVEDPSHNSAGDDTGPTLQVIRSLSEPAIYVLTHGQANGEVRAGVDTLDVAVLSTHTLVARALLNLESSPKSTADWIVELLLDGVSQRAPTTTESTAT